MRLTLAERLARGYIKTPGGCWLWMKSVDKDGYGRIQYGGQWGMAHRAIHGHEFTPENTRVHAGRRNCRACGRVAAAQYKLRRTA